MKVTSPYRTAAEQEAIRAARKPEHINPAYKEYEQAAGRLMRASTLGALPPITRVFTEAEEQELQAHMDRLVQKAAQNFENLFPKKEIGNMSQQDFPTIDKGIPLPPKVVVKPSPTTMQDFYRSMEIGDSVFFPGINKRAAGGKAANASKALPSARFAIRATDENGVTGIRMWRVS